MEYKRGDGMSRQRMDAGFSGIISRNKKMNEIFTLVKRVMNLPVTILILGKTGQGRK